MDPFDVTCPACQRVLRIKDPSVVGKKIFCPKCKERFRIEAPTTTTAASEEAVNPISFLPSGDSPAASLNTTASKSPATKTKVDKRKPAGKPKWMWFSAGGVILLAVIAGGLKFYGNYVNQQNIANLSGADKLRYEELRKQHGDNINVVTTGSSNTPTSKKTPLAEKLPEVAPVPRADELANRLQDLVRIHKRNPKMETLRSEFEKARHAYTHAQLSLDDFEVQLDQLTADADRVVRELVHGELKKILEQEGLKDDLIPGLVQQIDNAVMSKRFDGWKLDDTAQKEMQTTIQESLVDQQLDMNQQLIQHLLSFAEQYY